LGDALGLKERDSVPEFENSAPFVISTDGGMYVDAAGNASDRQLAGGAREVLAAGRLVAVEGRVLVITNESPTYHPSLPQMQAAVTHWDLAGIDLTGDGEGILVVVYATLDKFGRGVTGKRYRAKKSGASVELVPEE
jgi:hypothetical protein